MNQGVDSRDRVMHINVGSYWSLKRKIWRGFSRSLCRCCQWHYFLHGRLSCILGLMDWRAWL